VRLGFLAIAALLSSTLSGRALAQDFDPRGHRSHPARAPAPRAGGPEKEPPQAVLIERYIRIVLAQPGAATPLERLAQLCRARDGSLKAIIAEFQQRAAQNGSDAHPAMVAVAGLLKLAGHPDEAIDAYKAAVSSKADDSGAILALARLFEERGDVAQARARYEDALALQTAAIDREQTLRELMSLSLDASDFEGAKKYHRELLKLEPTNLFVRGELGRELDRRGEYVRAEEEIAGVVKAATGDNRALAPALKELGQIQAKAHENQQALGTLQRALAAAGGETALRAEIYQTIAAIYRADQRLPVLIQQLEAEHPADAPRLALLGGLYEETGDGARAVATYRRALAVDPRQIDLRLRTIHLLQSEGDLDRAIVEYESLIRATPNNPQFVFEACDALLQRGDRSRALRLLAELEAHLSGDDEALSRLAEFYGQIGDSARSLAILQHLAASETAGDGGHLVDLGDRYFQDGKTPLALETWKHILVVVRPRARALAALGDVLLEHDMTPEAIEAYKEAAELEPKNVAVEKALASAYERAHSYREAEALYEGIVARSTRPAERPLVRECRSRIVTLWSLQRTLEKQLPDLRRRFASVPADIEAGKMLAESLAHLHRLPEAEQALRQIVAAAPGDPETYLVLERTLVQQDKIADALVVLETLVQVEPARARELYERMAQYALRIYRDDDAVRYALRAVELNPDDAEGHRRLGELYRSKQDFDHAIAEFRAAIAKNERMFPVYFELADLLLARAKSDEADRLFRAVVRGSPDQELVARAARFSMQIHLERSTLETLEGDLLPLAIGNPQKPIYRRLLVELYGNLTYGLVRRVRHGSASDASQAREALGRIGTRAVKPLLDALADDDVSQQRIAIDVLAYVRNPNAALPLFTFATGKADLDLRARAMLACGSLADSALLGKYSALLFPSGSGNTDADLGDPVAAAAVLGLAHMKARDATPLLRRVAFGDGPPPMRTLAMLGLGFHDDRASLPQLAAVAESREGNTFVRASAIEALGRLGARNEMPFLVEIAENGEPWPRAMALVALARLSSPPPDGVTEGNAVRAMADSLFAGVDDDSGEPSDNRVVPRAAAAALTLLAAHHDGEPQKVSEGRDELPSQEASNPSRVLEDLLPSEASDEDRAAVLIRFAGPIGSAAATAIRTSADGAREVLDSLGEGNGEFRPFVLAGAAGPASEAARSLAAALRPSIASLARHPDARIRERALRLLARSTDDAAATALVDGLADPSEEVRRVALASIGSSSVSGGAAARTIATLGAILSADDNWSLRVLAARALGRVGAANPAGASARLAASAQRDPYALVREAALEALGTLDPDAARPIARSVAASDPEPRVREAAEAMAR
jgi:tetratricopeptide (TPR) repeat protein